MVDRVDGGIGSVSFGFRGDPEDKDRPGERPHAGDERDRPGPREVRRGGLTSLADRSRHRVPGNHSEEQVGRFAEGLVEDDRAKAGGDADEHAEGEPLARVGR